MDEVRTEALIGRHHAPQKRATAARAYAPLLFGGRRSISPDNIADADIKRFRRAIRISVLLETVLVVLVSGSILVFAYLARDSHRRVEADAMLASIDLTRAIGTEIDRNLASVKLAMEATVKALQIPNIWNTDPELRNAALFGSKGLVRGISTLAIIDRDGRLLAHSLDLVAPDMRFDDRAYFVKAEEDASPGILVTGPMFGRTTNKDVLLLSQRLLDANRHFAGVVTGSIYMSYFQEVCEPILLGRDDAIGIMYLDGAPILRLPKFSFSTYSNADEYDTLELVAHAQRGAYIGRSRYDGISRLTAYETFNDEQPLFLYYSRTTNSIFREWRRTYMATGLLLTVMWVTKIYTIVSLHRRRHRMAAEGLKAANRARMEALGRLAGGVAHDINGILQIITGAGDIILSRPERRSEVERLCGVILKTARRGGEVTRRLLTFARQDMLSPTEIDLDVLLKEISELLDPLLGKLVKVNYLAPSVDLPRIRADRSQLETVLINLATNSRDAMPTGGIITIAASPDFERKMVRIDVSDTGVGFAPEVLARAMEPYYSTKEINEGTGLGLAMAKGFVEQSGGALDIQTEQGVGTTVSIWMPM